MRPKTWVVRLGFVAGLAVAAPASATIYPLETRESVSTAIVSALSFTDGAATDKAKALKEMFPLEWEALTAEFIDDQAGLDVPGAVLERVSAFTDLFESARAYQAGRASLARIRTIYLAMADLARIAQTDDPAACPSLDYKGITWTKSASAAQIAANARLTQALYSAIRDAGPPSFSVRFMTPADWAILKAATLAAGATPEQQSTIYGAKTGVLAPRDLCAARAIQFQAIAQSPAPIPAAYWRNWTEQRLTSGAATLANWTKGLETYDAAFQSNMPVQWNNLRKGLAKEIAAGHDNAVINQYISAFRDQALAEARTETAKTPTADLLPLFATLKPFAAKGAKTGCGFGLDPGPKLDAAADAYNLALLRAARAAELHPFERGPLTTEDRTFLFSHRQTFSIYGLKPKGTGATPSQDQACRQTALSWAIVSSAPPETAARFWALSVAGDTSIDLDASGPALPDVNADLATVRTLFPDDAAFLAALEKDAAQKLADPQSINRTRLGFAVLLILKRHDDLGRAPLPQARAVIRSELDYLQALEAQSVPLCARYVVGEKLPPTLKLSPAVSGAGVDQVRALLAAVVAGFTAPVVYDAFRTTDSADFEAALEKAGGDPRQYRLIQTNAVASLDFNQICNIATLNLETLLALPDAAFGRWWGLLTRAPTNAWVIHGPSG